MPSLLVMAPKHNIAERQSLGIAIALASTVYVAAGLLLLTAIVFFVKRDALPAA